MRGEDEAIVNWRGGEIETLLMLGERLDQTVSMRGGDGQVRPAAVREVLAVSLLKIRDKQGQIRTLESNLAQRQFEARCGRRNIVLKARQLGMTTWVAARYFLKTITHTGTLTVLVAQDRDAAEEIFRIVHRMVENLPRAVRATLRTSRANARQIVFPELDSGFRVESAGDACAGRGLTIQNLHCSELARWPGDVEETLASLRAALVPDGEMTIESTANGAWGTFYHEWMTAEQSGTVRHFFPWWVEASYRGERLCGPAAAVPATETSGRRVAETPLTEEERDLTARTGLDAAQIAFRRQVKQEFGRRAQEEFAEDAESCFLATGECIFDVAKLEARRRELREPFEIRDHGRTEIYWPAQPGREYVVGVDAAGGGSEGDRSAIEVVERATGLQCAEWHGHCTLAELAKSAAALAREYNGALLAVERNNHGYGVLAHLEVSERYARLFADGGGVGWGTTVLTRPRMIEQVMSMVEGHPELVGSRRLLGECKTFVRHADGRCAAAAGEHDDTVMAMGVALAARGSY